MKRLLFIALTLLILIGNGFSASKDNQPEINTFLEKGAIEVAYDEPIDFKHYEVYISTTPNFNPTGWNGTTWVEKPNAVKDWDGDSNNLFMVSTTKPIQVTGLTPGETYYVRVVAVDKANQRSIPSAEVSAMAGDAQRSSTVVVAASDASSKSKAGADYVCTGVDDQITLASAIAALPQDGGAITLTEGTFSINGSIAVPSNVQINGSGLSTIIHCHPSVTDYYYVFTNVDPTNGNSDIVLSNFKVVSDASSDTQYSPYGAVNFNNVTNCTVSKVTSHTEFLRYTCFIKGDNNKILECSFSNNIYNHYTEGYITICATVLINGTKNKIINNYVFDGGQGIVCHQGGTNTISGNHVFKNQADGIRLLDTENNMITGNEVHSNNMFGIEYGGTVANILIENSSYNNIQNNTCRKGNEIYAPQYGIHVSSGTGNLVTNNDCFDGGSNKGIYNTGTATNFGAGNRNNNGTWSTTPN